MARTFARLKASVWTDDDWRTLPPGSQWAYMLLLSQPHINNCGVLPYLPGRWARLAAGVTEHDVDLFLDVLEQRRFVVVDRDAGEVLIRSFVKHDGVEKVPNVKASAERQYAEIESRSIKTVLSAEYPHLFTPTNGPKAPGKANLVPVAEPLSLRVAQPLVEGDNARVPSPTPANNPNTSSQQTDPQARGSTTADAAGDDLDQDLQAQLEHLGWKPWQIRRATDDPARAHAIAQNATELHAAGDVDNPGGWAWAEYDSGRAPAGQPQSTLAPGAYAATRSAPAAKLPFECPHTYPDGTHCGSTFSRLLRLEEHIADCHTEHDRGPLPPEVADLLDRATPTTLAGRTDAPPLTPETTA